MTKISAPNRFWRSLTKPYRWWLRTPERALDQSYEAALRIQSIEDEHFHGRRISSEENIFSDAEFSYFQSELVRYLNISRIRMAEFKASRFIVNRVQWQVDDDSVATPAEATFSQSQQMLTKITLIEQVFNRYQPQRVNPRFWSSSGSSLAAGNGITQSTSMTLHPKSTGTTLPDGSTHKNGAIAPPKQFTRLTEPFIEGNNGQELTSKPESLTDKTGVLPRSILGTLDRLRRELDPDAEQEVVKTFRVSKAKTVLSLRFILLLLLVPLLTQQITKNFIVGPIVDHLRGQHPDHIFINFELEEEGLSELQRFEATLRFKTMVGAIPSQSQEQMGEQIKEKATEIAMDYRRQSANAIKNVFADLFSAIAFAIIIFSSRREIEILKKFLDELIYGLSDSAKAFIIILFSDIFVGFHSPHGWEVLLEGLSRHLGLPANHDFIFIFIATFPVILDTVFKYWIFRYLNRVSPSAVATYRTMNE
ncbi:MAG: proton extrusion protein PcxA [Cyanobacteria bacterium REEB444]|nr:proton extrusion protein PcxA [Cyanobacteria bacterium REEB444]